MRTPAAGDDQGVERIIGKRRSNHLRAGRTRHPAGRAGDDH
jgi:hypothetical protein